MKKKLLIFLLIIAITGLATYVWKQQNTTLSAQEQVVHTTWGKIRYSNREQFTTIAQLLDELQAHVLLKEDNQRIKDLLVTYKNLQKASTLQTYEAQSRASLRGFISMQNTIAFIMDDIAKILERNPEVKRRSRNIAGFFEQFDRARAELSHAQIAYNQAANQYNLMVQSSPVMLAASAFDSKKKPSYLATFPLQEK